MNRSPSSGVRAWLIASAMVGIFGFPELFRNAAQGLGSAGLISARYSSSIGKKPALSAKRTRSHSSKSDHRVRRWLNCLEDLLDSLGEIVKPVARVASETLAAL